MFLSVQEGCSTLDPYMYCLKRTEMRIFCLILSHRSLSFLYNYPFCITYIIPFIYRSHFHLYMIFFSHNSFEIFISTYNTDEIAARIWFFSYYFNLLKYCVKGYHPLKKVFVCIYFSNALSQIHQSQVRQNTLLKIFSVARKLLFKKNQWYMVKVVLS